VNGLSVLWRDKQIEYTRLTSMSGQYRPFWELTRAGLRYAALRLGLALDATGRRPADEPVPGISRAFLRTARCSPN